MSRSSAPAALCASVAFLVIHPFAPTAPACAQTTDAAPYRMFRWQEDYSGLAAAVRDGHRTLKHVPLASNAWVSFGGEIRERVEEYPEPGLGFGASGADTYVLQRVLAHADIHAGSKVRAFVELGAFEAFGKDVEAPPAVDRLDLQQAFVDLRIDGSQRAVTAIRVGRQEMAFGSQRLVGIRDGPNVRRNYDGLRVMRSFDARQLDLIAVRPVKLRDGVFDNQTDDDLAFFGLYFTTPLRRVPGALDLYALGYEHRNALFASAAGDEHRQSFGARFFGYRDGWDWDIEPTIQTGSIADQDILAWGLATNTGYRMSVGSWMIRVGAKLDYASGDDNPHDRRLGTANAMFPRLPYLGSAGAFAPSNIIDVQPSLAFAPNDDLLVTFGYQLIWRASTDDAVYVAPLIPFPNTAGVAGRFTAQQWPIDVSWRVNRHLQVEASVAWVKVEDWLKASGAEDAGFAFVSAAYRF